jgi:hypothetical protein
MALICGLKGKFPCPICLVPWDEQSANRVFALRTTFNSQHILCTARAKHTEKEQEDTHFKAVMSVDFNDGSFHEDISKVQVQTLNMLYSVLTQSLN